MSQRLSLKTGIERIVLLSFLLAFACLLFFSFYVYGRLQQRYAAGEVNEALHRDIFSVFLLTTACTGLFLILLYILVRNLFSRKSRAENQLRSFNEELASQVEEKTRKTEKSRRFYATISQVNKTIMYAREADDLFQRICSVLVETGKFRMAWIGRIDNERRVISQVCHAGYVAGYLDLIEVSIEDVPTGRGPTGTAMRERRHYICNSVRTDPAMVAWKDEALRRNYLSSIALPILLFGELHGSLSIYSEEENFFDEEEVNLLDEVVGDISFTLEIFEREKLRKKVEKEVREEKQFSDSLINSLPGIFYLYDDTHRFLRWNKQFEEISGYSREEFMQMTVLDFFKGIQKEVIRQKIETVFATGRCEVEAELSTKNGDQIPFFFSGRKVTVKGIPAVLGTGFDVTRLKEAENLLRQSEEDLRDLASNLQNIREEERTSISREIHDELGQQLTAIKLDVSWLDRRIFGDEVIKERIANVLAMLTDMIHTIRRISTQLRPSVLDDLGLVEGLKWQVREFQARTGILVRFESPEEPLKLEPGITTGFFRIFQEALTNIVRHAEATEVTASLCVRDGQLLLTIADNGKGFDPGMVKKKKTLGLLGMKERTLMMKGTCEIDSQPGKGTCLRISVPVYKLEQQPTPSP